jgi:DNA-binding NarL/FixJ family response regulator
MAIKVFVYDDNESRRDSLKALIYLTPEIAFVGASPDCSNLSADMIKYQPDVVLMDINMPNVDGMEGLRQIRQLFPHIKVLMQTVFDDSEKIFTSIRNGASGYILKKDPPQRILQAIQEVYEGGAVMNPGIAQKVLDFFQPKKIENPLTDRETQVLTLLAEGLSYKMIADKLALSFHTVNTHAKNIYEKLHVASLGEAIAFYYKNLQ